MQQPTVDLTHQDVLWDELERSILSLGYPNDAIEQDQIHLSRTHFTKLVTHKKSDRLDIREELRNIIINAAIIDTQDQLIEIAFAILNKEQSANPQQFAAVQALSLEMTYLLQRKSSTRSQRLDKIAKEIIYLDNKRRMAMLDTPDRNRHTINWTHEIIHNTTACHQALNFGKRFFGHTSSMKSVLGALRKA